MEHVGLVVEPRTQSKRSGVDPLSGQCVVSLSKTLLITKSTGNNGGSRGGSIEPLFEAKLLESACLENERPLLI